MKMASKDKNGSNVQQDSKKGITTTTVLSDNNDKVMYHTCHCPSSKSIEFLVFADNLIFPIDEARIAQSCKNERHQNRVTFIVGTSLRCSQMKCFITTFLEGMKKGVPNKFFVIQIAVGSYDFVWVSSKNGTVRIERRNSTDIFQELQSLKKSILSFFPTALVFFYPVPDLSRALRTGSDSPNLEAENDLEMEISKLNKKLQNYNESFFCLPGDKSLKHTWACKNVRRKYSKIWKFVSERRVSVDPENGMYLNSFLHDSVFDFACCMFRKVGRNSDLKPLSKDNKNDNCKSETEKPSETKKACLTKQIPGVSSYQDASRTESKSNSSSRAESSASELEQGELIDSEDEMTKTSERSESPSLKKGHSGHPKSSVESNQSFLKEMSSCDKRTSIEASSIRTSDGGNDKSYRRERKLGLNTTARDSRGKSSSSHDSPDREKLSKSSQSDSLEKKSSRDDKDSSHRKKSSHSDRSSSYRDRKSSYSTKSSDSKKLDKRHKHSYHRRSPHSDKDSHHRKTSKERDSSERRKDQGSSDRRSPYREGRRDRISSKEDRTTHRRRRSSSERYLSEKRSSRRDRSPSSRRNSSIDEKASSDGRSDDAREVLGRRRRSRDRSMSGNHRRKSYDKERVVLSSDRSVSPQRSRNRSISGNHRHRSYDKERVVLSSDRSVSPQRSSGRNVSGNHRRRSYDKKRVVLSSDRSVSPQRSRDRSTSGNHRRRSHDKERVGPSSDRSVSPQSSNSIILLDHDTNRAKSPASDSSRSTQIFSLNKTSEKSAHQMKPDASSTYDSISLSSRGSTSQDDAYPYQKDHGLRDLYVCHENECKLYIASPYAHPDYAKEKKMFTSSWLAKHQATASSDSPVLEWDWNLFWKSRMKELFDESWNMKKEIYLAQKKKSRADRRRKRGSSEADFESYLSNVKEYNLEEKVQKWQTSKKKKHSGSADRSLDSLSDEVSREERTKIYSHAKSKGQEKELKSCHLEFKHKESAPAADCRKIDTSLMKKVIGPLVFPETHRDPIIKKLLMVLKVHPHLALLTASLKYMLDYALKLSIKMEDTVTLLEDEDNLIILEMVQKKLRSLLEGKGNSDFIQDLQKALKATEDLITMSKSIKKPHFGLNLYSLALVTRGVEEDVLKSLVEGLALCSGRGEVNPQNVQQTCQVVQSLLK